MAGALKDKAVSVLVSALGLSRGPDPEMVTESPTVEITAEPSLIEKARAKAAEDAARHRKAKFDDLALQRKNIAMHASKTLETEVTSEMVTARPDTADEVRPTWEFTVGGLRFMARFDGASYHYSPQIYMYTEKGQPKSIYRLTDVLK